VIRIEAAAEDSMRLDVESGTPELTISGNGTALVEAAAALGSPGVVLAGEGDVSDVGLEVLDRADDSGQTRLPLSDLGTGAIALGGSRSTATYLAIRQDLFGAPLQALDVHLEGWHSAVPDDVTARLDAYLNGELVDSEELGRTPDVEMDLHIEGGEVRPENALELVLRAAPMPGCGGSGARLPVEVSISAARSSVAGAAGDGGLSALQRFPQILGGRVPVAFGLSAGSHAVAAVEAADVLAALQRTASSPLEVALVPSEEMFGERASGLLVAANDEDTRRLGAPLRLAQVRMLDEGAQRFEVSSSEPFAALQAVMGDGRAVLVLGGWAPPDQQNRVLQLMRRTTAWIGERGWSSLSADYVVSDGEGRVAEVHALSVVPQEEVLRDQQRFAWFAAAGVLVLLLVLVASALVHGRRVRAVRRLVRAQEEFDAGSGSEE
jgi:hypothetical protein